MLHRLKFLAKGRILIALEGGYNLTSISNSAEACIRQLLHEILPYEVSKEKHTFEELRKGCYPLAKTIKLGEQII